MCVPAPPGVFLPEASSRVRSSLEKGVRQKSGGRASECERGATSSADARVRTSGRLANRATERMSACLDIVICDEMPFPRLDRLRYIVEHQENIEAREYMDWMQMERDAIAVGVGGPVHPHPHGGKGVGGPREARRVRGGSGAGGSRSGRFLEIRMGIRYT